MSFLTLFIPNLWQFITLILLMHISTIVAYLLVYNPRLRLPQLDAFNMYPWVCIKCMTFWTNLVPNIVLAYIWNPAFVLWGLITASALTYATVYSENH